MSSCFFLYLSDKKKYKKTRTIFVIIALLIPSVIAGIRDYTIGTDVLLYGNNWFERAISYESMYQYLMKAKEYSVGVGYAAINFIVSRFSSSPHMFYFVYELLQLTVLYAAIKPYKNKLSVAFAFLIYYFLFFNNSLNILRQAMAIVLVLYSYRFARDKKNVGFCVTIALAYSFHSSAIVGLAIYPICWAYRKRFVKKWVRPMIVVASLSLIVGYRSLFELLTKTNLISGARYEKYLTQDIIGGRYIGLAYWFIIILLLINTRKENKLKLEDASVLEMFLFISAIFTLLPFFGSALLSRVSYYFDIFQVVFLPVVSEHVKVKVGNKKSACIIKKAVVIMPVAVYWMITYIVRNGAHTYPYLFMR